MYRLWDSVNNEYLEYNTILESNTSLELSTQKFDINNKEIFDWDKIKAFHKVYNRIIEGYVTYNIKWSCFCLYNRHLIRPLLEFEKIEIIGSEHNDSISRVDYIHLDLEDKNGRIMAVSNKT